MRDLQPDCSQTYCRRYVSKYSAYCSEPRYAIWLCRRNCPHVHVICAGAKPPGFSGSPARTYSGSRHLHRLKILTCGYATTWIGAERHAGRTPTYRRRQSSASERRLSCRNRFLRDFCPSSHPVSAWFCPSGRRQRPPCGRTSQIRRGLRARAARRPLRGTARIGSDPVLTPS